ncbi:uncharacterized protein LOC110934177 [Helianthus annuus]|uniref:uncharacterized protein LOC110934177 n=1 Tax=Helianthus annuus TaxID=4232 RepID=UPI000B903F18|nr:uncharacterized protein LOC110934177 [Helianthus annuus]
MNFPEKWRLWVRGILMPSRSSILVNGSPTCEFQCHRGVRQGDPLSPFIFILAMEALSSFMVSANSAGLIRGISLPNGGPSVSHLVFADGVMLMGEWSEQSILNVKRLMRCFYLVSGLKINLKKSCLYNVGVSPEVCDQTANLLGCKAGSLPFTYLGLNVRGNMNRYHNWAPVIDSFEARLSLWKASTFSIGGRTTLVKSVLDSLPVYYFSLYLAPSNMINKLEQLRRNFLWGDSNSRNRMHWVNWEKVTKPVKNGGLGLGSLRHTNVRLLMKWTWRYKTETSRLWRAVISSIHYNPRHGNFLPTKRGLSGVWNNIIKKESDLRKKKHFPQPLYALQGGQRFWRSVLDGRLGIGHSFSGYVSLSFPARTTQRVPSP